MPSTVTDVNSCTAADTILIKTICNDKNYFLPNTFTPNETASMIIFYPRGTSLYNIQSLTIFNRWGTNGFPTTQFPRQTHRPWAGTEHSTATPAPADAYVYIAEVICDNSQVIAPARQCHADTIVIMKNRRLYFFLPPRPDDIRRQSAGYPFLPVL